MDTHWHQTTTEHGDGRSGDQYPSGIGQAQPEVPSDSLQNPSDPNATYDGHKGKGYQAQVADTYSAQSEDKSLSLITCIEVEAAHQSDAYAVEPYLEQGKSRGVLEVKEHVEAFFRNLGQVPRQIVQNYQAGYNLRL